MESATEKSKKLLTEQFLNLLRKHLLDEELTKRALRRQRRARMRRRLEERKRQMEEKKS
jgi:hypothetical protein